MMAAPALAGGLERPELARDSSLSASPSLGPANTMASAQSCDLLNDWDHGLPLAIRWARRLIALPCQ